MVPPCSDRIARVPPYSCPVITLTRTGLSPISPAFPCGSDEDLTGTGLIRVRSPLLTESRLMSFPPGTEMFQFPRFASPTYQFSRRYPIGVGCPIRISTDQSLLAAPHGFSQRATSFIASWCQGIHRMPFSCSRSSAHPRNGVPFTMHGNHPQTPTVRTGDPSITSPTRPSDGSASRQTTHSAHNSDPSAASASQGRQPSPRRPDHTRDANTPNRSFQRL